MIEENRETFFQRPEPHLAPSELLGVQLLFLLAKPHARVTVDLKLKTDPICPDCGRAYRPRELLENTASDTFDVTMKQ